MAKINGKTINRNINVRTPKQVAEYITKLNDNKITTEINGNNIIVKSKQLNNNYNINIVK